MGDFRVRTIKNTDERNKMYDFAIRDIEAFEKMLAENMFDTSHPKIGAEQELCIIGKDFSPTFTALEILADIEDKRYTNELAKFNLELNLDPLDLSGTCFSQLEKTLIEALDYGAEVAKEHNTKLFLAGILPTLKYRHLSFRNMTPIRRYKTISESLAKIRGSDFDIYLQGVDEMIMSLDSVLFEACNTSFQLHLQIHPEEFVKMHNWSQMIAGPVLSACTNSPLLFGNELWAETRIALFKQSLDTRSPKKFLRRKQPRVYFGNSWLIDSPAEIWKKDITRFPLLVTSDYLSDSVKELNRGVVPELRAIRLHNGTTYTWNRLIYGHPNNNPHLRIECRYLPAGPTVVDEIANFMFWIGLMNSSFPDKKQNFWEYVDFRVAKSNFVNAARTGLTTVFHWFGRNYSAKELLLEKLMPLALEGLYKLKINEADIKKYMRVIERRVDKEQTGAAWQADNYRILRKKYSEHDALNALVQESLTYQKNNTPIHEWKPVYSISKSMDPKENKVSQLMATDIFCVTVNQNFTIVKAKMEWNNIRHLPVEDDQGNLVGILTDGIIQREPDIANKSINELMIKDPVTVDSDDSVHHAMEIMQNEDLTSLPVVYKGKIVGIITNTDIQRFKAEQENQGN